MQKLLSIAAVTGALNLVACSGGGSGTPVATVGCTAQAPSATSTVVKIANTGRMLAPLGRMTAVGNFPTGGHLTPDGRFYWSVSAGHGENDVHVVDVASGCVAQVLPLAGTYGQMAFSPDGKVAYVSGTSQGHSRPGTTLPGKDGDVVHVFDVEVASGAATERVATPYPLVLPPTSGGSARSDEFPPTDALPSNPVGLAVSPDGAMLIVALYNADQVAVIDTKHPETSNKALLVGVGKYPYAVAFGPDGKNVYVSNAYDGTLSKFDATTSSPTVTTIAGLGGPDSDHNAQPQYVLTDPKHNAIYVAVTNHDGVAVVDANPNSATKDSVIKFISLKRTEGYGTQPVALALSPDASTLYAANAGENAIVEIALADRPSVNAHAFDVIGKIPTADYASDVQVTPDGAFLVWQAARGIGTGANPRYTSSHGYPAVNNATDPRVSPYPSFGMDLEIGRVGVTPLPTDQDFARLTAAVESAQAPENPVPAPADTPVKSGGPIKYVFYVVKENRTYDQLYGSDPRGDGDPALEVLEDNCRPGNTAFVRDRSHFGCGTTPNQHALTRQFVLLDNFYEDSDESLNGHEITTGAYSTNYSLKSVAQDYGGRPRPSNQVAVFPVTFPPKYFLFDQAVTQNISFHNYGELAGGATPKFSDDGRSTYSQVIANSDTTDYPSNIFNGCYPSNQNAPNTPACAFDCGLGCNLPTAPMAVSRIDAFNKTFMSQAAGCTEATVGTPACGVPQFNYLIMMSDHTNGVANGARDPLSMVADNDLGVGQFVQIVSSSAAVWAHAAIFVVEDDSQDGADHVDAHRAPALVMGPYVKHGGQVVHAHYDQYSMIRTIELILGMDPLSVFDALAAPMYDAFMPTTTAPDVTPYTAIQPEYSLFFTCNTATHPCVTGDKSASKVAAAAALQLAQANAELSAALPFNQPDRVPQAINDRLLWQRVFGTSRPVPPPGPNASRLEHARAVGALHLWERYRFFAPLARERLYQFLDDGD